ncbi:MAG TPA: NUDIX domain-containing protein [Anaerolineales bacterium]|nr:NUDIX domain-containing protein [Anaerolineales bacterium]HNB37353.1 NUDIX domain-containing protein [Anaerolineales bacterium]
MYYKFLYFGYKVYCFLLRPIRMGVRVLMLEDGKVWMIRHTYMSGWHLPGGGLKKKETLDQAARREAWEETGAELGEISLLGTFTGMIQWKTDHTIVFLCRDFKVTGKSDGEIAEMRAFPLDALPKDTFYPHRRLLERFREGQLEPNYGKW